MEDAFRHRVTCGWLRDLERLKGELAALDVLRREVVERTLASIDGTLGEIAALG